MIPLKEHNDIVQKLMKELAGREAELKALAKEKNKVASQAPQLQPSANEKMLTGRINQLNKEYKDKISTLTQQLRSKSTENKELRERLTAKANLEAKEKDHIAEVLKKNYDRKPSSAADYKVSALIAHYQAEIAKKVKYIENLQKQLREAENEKRSSTQEDNQNYKDALENEQKPKGVTLVEHQREVGRIKIEAAKFKKLYEEKEKEYKDLSRRYTDLTNEYYKIINAYGLEEQPKTDFTLTKMRSVQNFPKSKQNLQTKLKANALQNLLHEMAVSDSEQEPSRLQGIDSPRQIKVKPTRITSYQDEGDLEAKESFAISKLEEVLGMLGLSDPGQLIPALSKMKTQNEEIELADTICRSLQVFLYNIGKGKLSRRELVQALQDFEHSYTRSMEAVDLLDEVCVQAGAKRQKLQEKIQQLLQTKSEYFEQLKSLKFTQQLGKANKVLEFIEFFELDKQQVALPQQLTYIQEQLKAINKYIKEVRVILEIDAEKSSQMVLELALRYMEKSTSFMAQYQKKTKPKNTS